MKAYLIEDRTNQETKVQLLCPPYEGQVIIFENQQGMPCITQITEIQQNLIDNELVCATMEWKLANTGE